MAPKIDAHVLVYTLMFGITTAAAVGFSRTFAKPKEELDAELRAKYPELIKRSQDQKVHMQAFFDKMKDRDSTALDKDFNAILRGGNGDIKRTQLYDKVKVAEAVVVADEATQIECKEREKPIEKVEEVAAEKEVKKKVKKSKKEEKVEEVAIEAAVKK